MAHAQKPYFVFWRNGRVHLNRRGRQSSRLLASRGVHISGSNAGYTMFRGSVKGTGYPLHSPVSPSLPHPCVIVCHHISTGLYAMFQPRVPGKFHLTLRQQIPTQKHTLIKKDEIAAFSNYILRHQGARDVKCSHMLNLLAPELFF